MASLASLATLTPDDETRKPQRDKQRTFTQRQPRIERGPTMLIRERRSSPIYFEQIVGIGVIHADLCSSTLQFSIRLPKIKLTAPAIYLLLRNRSRPKFDIVASPCQRQFNDKIKQLSSHG
jgi:hypothetical protein